MWCGSDDDVLGGLGPTLSSFIEFVQTVMAPPAPFDPTTSIYVPYAFTYAQQCVSSNLTWVPGVLGASNIYALATYNFAGDQLVQIVQDPTPFQVYKDGLPYWQWLRKQLGVLSFTPGVVQSTSDNGTSTALLVPQQFQNATINDLQLMKTPYGRAYLGLVGSWGSQWGMC